VPHTDVLLRAIDGHNEEHTSQEQGTEQLHGVRGNDGHFGVTVPSFCSLIQESDLTNENEVNGCIRITF